MNKRTNRLLVPVLAVVLLIACCIGISSGFAKYSLQLAVGTVDLDVTVINVKVTDLFYNGTGFYADPDCTIPVVIETDESGNKVLVASKNGTTITRMSQFNGVVGDFNIWLEATYTTFGSETLSGGYTIRRYDNFAGTMISVVNGSPTIAVTVDGSKTGGTVTYWDAGAKTTATKEIGAQTAIAPAITVDGGKLNLSGTVQNNNNSQGNGGGILVLSGSLNCADTAKVTGNHAAGNGGGICYEYGKADVGNLLDTYAAKVTGNDADGKGDQVYPAVQEVFAVLDTDGVLHFYNRIGVPAPGDTIDGVTVAKVYTDFINTNDVPWNPDGASVNRVVMEDNNIAPTTTEGWFEGMENVTKIDLTKLNTTNTTDMDNMFSGCKNLETILVGDNWSVGNNTSANNMFTGCTTLTGGAGSTGLTAADGTVARVDGGTAHPGYLTYNGYALVFEPNYTPFDGNPNEYPDVQTSDSSGAFTVDTSSFQPARSGYKFLGWAADPAAAAAEFAAGGIISYTVTGDVPVCGRLYAVWEKDAEEPEADGFLVLRQNNTVGPEGYGTISYNLYWNVDGVETLVDLSHSDYSGYISGSNYIIYMPYVGNVLSIYASLNGKDHYDVYFDGRSDATGEAGMGGEDTSKLNLNFTASGKTMTLKYIAPKNSDKTETDYWFAAIAARTRYNYSIEISNLTIDGGGHEFPNSPIYVGTGYPSSHTIYIENVTFVNMVTGPGTDSATHEDIIYVEASSGSNHVNNVRFINCTPSEKGWYSTSNTGGDHHIHFADTHYMGDTSGSTEVLYTVDGSGSSEVSVTTANGEETLPATENAVLVLTPVSGKDLPSEFPVKINDKEYMIRPDGESDGEISVTENADGSYTVTIPKGLLESNAKPGGDNTITVDADAVICYTVSFQTENLTASGRAKARPDGDYTAELRPNVHHTLDSVSVEINGITYEMSAFETNGIVLGEDSCLTIPETLLESNHNPDGSNTIVIIARAVELPQYSIEAGELIGATLTEHAAVYPDEDCTDIVLTFDKPIQEYITVFVNNHTLYYLDTPGSSGVHFERSGNVCTITVPSSVMMELLTSEGNVITIGAKGRDYELTMTHTSITLPEKTTYPDNWVVKYEDAGLNDDGSYSTFVSVEEGFVIDIHSGIQVTVTVDGYDYITYLSRDGTNGDISYDPETGEVRIHADYLAMFENQDIHIDVSVNSVDRVINVNAASEISYLTSSTVWSDIDESHAYILELTGSGHEDEWLKSVTVRFDDTYGHSKEFIMTRDEAMTSYVHLTFRWMEEGKEYLIFRGDKMIEWVHEQHGTDTKWITDDLTITFTGLEYEAKPSTAESAAFAAEASETPRHKLRAKVIRLDDKQPEFEPEPETPAETTDIPVNYTLTDLSYVATGDSAKLGEDYAVAFSYEVGFKLSESITVDIDGIVYTVKTDGSSNAEGLPVYDPAEDMLTIPGVLLTEEIKAVCIDAAAVAVDPTDEDNSGEETQPSTDEDNSGEETQPSADDGNSGEETQPSTDDGNSGEETQPSTDGGNSGEETQPSTDENNSGEETQPSTDENNSGEETQPSTDENNSSEETQPSTDENNSSEETQPPADDGNSGEETQPPADESNSSGETQLSADENNLGEEPQPLTDENNSGEEIQPSADASNSGGETQPPADEDDSGKSEQHTENPVEIITEDVTPLKEQEEEENPTEIPTEGEPPTEE